MNLDIIYIVKAFLTTKDLYQLELVSLLYYTSKVPLYQKQLRLIHEWPLYTIGRISYIFYWLCRHGHLNAIKYMVQTYSLDESVLKHYPTFEWTWHHRRLEVLKYIINVFQLSSPTSEFYSLYRTKIKFILRNAPRENSSEFVNYLRTTFDL